MSRLLTIVPALAMPGKPTPTMGTQVLAPDGSAIGGVKRIELVAEVNDIWRARIDCFVTAPTIENVSANVSEPVLVGPPLAWWRRALLRLSGVTRAEQMLLSRIRQKREA